ncbi:MAG: phenylacetate--CoA ligase family protein [Theionarchaea archaeon]|nr:phenylacetate--CoA ligase family protein [Theionarchaea archaeon]
MFQTVYDFAKIVRNPWKPPEELRRIQEKMMRNIVHFAYYNTRFYKEKFKKAGITPSDIKAVEDMEKIPVTTKDEVRKNPKSLFAAGYNENNCIVQQTTGSTGKILPVLHDKEAFSYFNAMGFRTFRDWGYRPWDKMILIRHDENEKILLEYLGLLRRYYIPIFTPEEKQIKIIKEINPDVLCAYPSTIKAIMSALKEGDLNGVTLKFINLNSEILTEKVRNQTRETFNCDVYDEYSTYEVVCIAQECPLHNFHIDSDSVIINFLDLSDEEVSCGESGRIVVTSLVNKAMPFIRYDLDDIGVLSDRQCECGRTFPLLQLVEGRKDDFLVMPSGALVSPRKIVPLVEITPGIEEFQVVQEKKDAVKIYVIKNESYSLEEEEKMINRLSGLFKEDVVIEPEYVNEIKRKKGKLRIVYSKVRQ